MKLFVMCSFGLEPLLINELAELGCKETKEGFCGVHVLDASMEDVYRINYCSRLASRVLLPLLRFYCEDKDTLYKKTLSVNWGNYFKKNLTFAIDSNVNHENLRNSLFAAQVVKDAICDKLKNDCGYRPDVDLQNPDIQLNLFIHEKEAIISLDTSGQPLHKRGYRKHTGAAPMQETLAAALLTIAGYDETKVIVDPCAGSGTLLIEAALMASKTPPGYLRQKWGFENHPNFDNQKWNQIKIEADSKKKKLKQGFFWGLEREKEITSFCRANSKAAGFEKDIIIECENFINHTPKADYNFLICNPPHGKRLASEDDLVPLYKALGDFMKQKLHKPAKGFIFTSSAMLSKRVGLQTKKRHIIKSSGMEARLLEFDIY